MLGVAKDLLTALAISDVFVAILDGHAVGLRGSEGSVFVADASRSHVLVCIARGIVREVAQHEHVLVLPVVFGDDIGPPRLSANDAGVQAGTCRRIFTEQDFGSSEAFVHRVLHQPASSSDYASDLKQSMFVAVFQVLQQYRLVAKSQVCPKCPRGMLELCFGTERNPIYWGCSEARSHKHFSAPMRLSGLIGSVRASQIPALVHFLVCVKLNMRWAKVVSAMGGGCT